MDVNLQSQTEPSATLTWPERQTALGSVLYLLLGAITLVVLACAAGLALPLVRGLPARLGPALRLVAQARPLLSALLLAAGLGLGLLLARYPRVYQHPGWLSRNLACTVQALFVRQAAAWLVLATVLCAAAVLYPYAPRQADTVPSHDSGIFLYFGQQILKGQLPYHDLWDHKPPLVFYIDALGLWLGNGSIWGVWFLEVLSLSAASLLGLLALRRAFGSGPALVAVTAMQAGLVFVLEGGNLTEEFALPFQFLALYLFLSSAAADGETRSGRRAAWRFAFIGAAFGAACMLKQTMVGVWVAIGAWMVFTAVVNAVSLRSNGFSRFFGKKRLKPLLPGGAFSSFSRALLASDLFWMLVGVLAVFGLVAAYFAVHNALYDLWDVAFWYNLIYSDAEGGQRLVALKDIAAFLTQTSGFFVVGLAGWVMGGVCLFIRRRALAARPVPLPLAALAIAWIDLPVELVLTNVSALNYRHYFMSLLPGLAFLAAFSAALLTKGLSNLLRSPRLAWLRRIGTVGLLALLWFGMVSASLPVLRKALQPHHDVTINQAVQYIRAHTASGDRVVMWGSQTVVNFLSGRAAPSRYVHAKPLFRAGYSSPAIAEQFLADLQREQPRLIINTNLASAPFLQKGPGRSCQLPAAPYPAWIQPVYTYICAHYVPVETLGKDDWQVWKLK